MSSKTPADMRQTISALVDGETSEWELRKVLQQSDTNEDVREYWATYQTLGAILRKEPNGSIDSMVDISSSIMSAIEEEPEPLHTSAINKVGYFKRTLGQTAIAASVAVVALIGIQQYQVAQTGVGNSGTIAETSTQNESDALVFPPQGFDLQPSTSFVSLSPTAPSQSQSTQVQIPVDRQQLELHLNELLQEHSANSVNAAQDTLPMIRVPASSSAE